MSSLKLGLDVIFWYNMYRVHHIVFKYVKYVLFSYDNIDVK